MNTNSDSKKVYVPPHLKKLPPEKEEPPQVAIEPSSMEPDILHTLNSGYDILLGKKWSDVEEN